MKILLADDDQDQLDLRSLLLTENGHQTIAATSAEAALAAAKTERPQCGVIDLNLPTEAQGLQLIRALKQVDPGIRIFVLTGIDSRRIRNLSEMNLIDEVIIKGCSTAHLMTKLSELASEGGPQLLGLRNALAKDRVVTFDVKAVPRSERSEVVGVTPDGAVKVRVAAPPEKGRANEELRDLLASWFNVPKNNVELLRGESSQRKVWRVRK